MISFEIYDFEKKSKIFESTLNLNVFGFSDITKVTNVEIFNRVRTILSRLHLTGDP